MLYSLVFQADSILPDFTPDNITALLLLGKLMNAVKHVMNQLTALDASTIIILAKVVISILAGDGADRSLRTKDVSLARRKLSSCQQYDVAANGMAGKFFRHNIGVIGFHITTP